MEKAKRNWIYCIRGLAIIAVVVCHQQGILHGSEYIQLASLYSVTTLIFLMGLTKALSLCRHGEEARASLLRYSARSMAPTLIAYGFATLAYLYIATDQVDLAKWWHSLLTFSASGPFYFIRYYLILSLLGPVLFAFARRILALRGPDGSPAGRSASVRRGAETAAFLFALWMIGYLTTDGFDILGSSYLPVYGAGICVGIYILEGSFRFNRKLLLSLGIVCLGGGLYMTKLFYFERVAGNEHYAKGLNALFPKLQMNPPNPEIVLYSAGVVICAYFLFKWLESKNMKILWKPFCCLGRYSMDIFLWHLLIRDQLIALLDRFDIVIGSGIVKNIVFYAAMFLIPMAYRLLIQWVKRLTYRGMKSIA